MFNPEARSLNLANCVALVLFEALRQQGFPDEIPVSALSRWLGRASGFVPPLRDYAETRPRVPDIPFHEPAHWGLGIEHWILDWSFPPNPKSSIQNPQCPMPGFTVPFHAQSRKGALQEAHPADCANMRRK